MLFFKIDQDLWSAMKAFIMFLNRFPEYPKTHMHDVKVDLVALKELNTTYLKNDKKKNSR